ncbi:hypothetical protein VWM66_10800, partial [Campylobacter jejuni]|uniref:hypothetical protein n=1 Tax=Campylobacter jejuni TaxID=197 RepID=UPI002F264BB6
VGLGDDEEVKISQSEQNKEKVFTTNTYKDELAKTKSINHTPSPTKSRASFIKPLIDEIISPTQESLEANQSNKEPKIL